jgi:hypothetical protein
MSAYRILGPGVLSGAPLAFFLLTRRRLGLSGPSHPRQPIDTSRKRDRLSHSRQRKDLRSKVSASLISAPGAGHPFVFLGRRASAARA